MVTNLLALEVSRKSSENIFVAGQNYHQSKVSDIKIIYDNLILSRKFSHNVLPVYITAHMR